MIVKKRAFIVVAAIAGVLIAGVLGAEAWLKHSIRTAIESALDGTGATVELGRLSVSLPRRSVMLREVRLLA